MPLIMVSSLTSTREAASDEKGAVLVIVAVAITAILVAASLAIDTSIWFVHRRHLQTQADAAALAGGQDFQYPCTAGGTIDQTIAATVHQYDGTTAPYPTQLASTGLNPQVQLYPTPGPANPATSAWSDSQHNLFSVIDRQNFFNQSQPTDTDIQNTSASNDGSPCTEGKIDVKLTESNLPSFLSIFGPAHINAQARVTIANVTAGGGAEPFATPLPTPATMTAQLVDESNSNPATWAISPVITLNNTTPDFTNWSGVNPSAFTFSNTGSGTFPVGLLVAFGGLTTQCGTAGVVCYEATSPNSGVTYTRVWSNSGTPGQPSSGTPTPPVAPQADKIAVAATPPATTPAPCPAGPDGINFSNFVSSSTSCSVQVSATNVQFASGSGAPAIDCTDASLTLTVGSASPVTLPCPTGTPLNGQTWTSNTVTVQPNAGQKTLTLKWKLTAGRVPANADSGSGDSSGNCTSSKPCTGMLGTQRINSGAFDAITSTASNSGPILGANLTDANGQIMSIQRGTPESIGAVAVTISLRGFTNESTIQNPTKPVELTFGGNNGNGTLKCSATPDSGNNFQTVVASGCGDVYQTTQPAPSSICSNGTTTPPCFATEQGGNGSLDNQQHGLDAGMNDRINGGGNTCTGLNYWASPNTIDGLLGQSPTDPRLLTMIITDPGALVNGANPNGVPVRALAEFYVTGWLGDPCIGHASGGPASNGLYFTGDDDPTALTNCNQQNNGGNIPNCDGVLLGHFIKFVNHSPTVTGSGQCSQASLDACVPILTK